MSKKKFIKHDEIENLIYQNKIYKPKYDIKKSHKLSEKILKKFYKKHENKLHYKGLNLISIVFQDFFWQYIFNYIKYRSFIDIHGKSLKIKINNNKYLFNGYARFQKFLFHKVSFKKLILGNLKILYLYLWTIYNLILFNKNKIIVSNQFIKNYRYNFFSKHIDSKDILILNFRLGVTKSVKSKNLDDAILNYINVRVDKLKHWEFLFRLLKPKKIILMDNLDEDYSIILAAKILNIQTIGITHGVTSKYHKWLFGYPFVKKKNILSFDKLYVAGKSYQNTLNKFGNIYSRQSIFVSGNLGINYFKLRKKKSNKYILYPYEFLTDFTNVIKILNFFHKKGYIIVIKKRADVDNYSQFGFLKPVFVDNYNKNHFENALCIFGLSTSILFELSFTEIPIVSMKESGLYLYEDINFQNMLYFNSNIIKKILRYKKKKIKQNSISRDFLNEFKSR